MGDVMSECNRPSPPEELVGALQDRVHPASGRLLSATPIEGRTRGTVTRELTFRLDNERWQRLKRIAEQADVEPIIESAINAILSDEGALGGVRGFMVTVYDPVTQALIDEVRQLMVKGLAQSDRFAELDKKLVEQLGQLSAWTVWRAWVGDPLYERVVQLAKETGVTPDGMMCSLLEDALERVEHPHAENDE